MGDVTDVYQQRFKFSVKTILGEDILEQSKQTFQNINKLSDDDIFIIFNYS